MPPGTGQGGQGSPCLDAKPCLSKQAKVAFKWGHSIPDLATPGREEQATVDEPWAHREGACVLVHGAEGTDSTLLITSLAQLILDPLSRTMAGFQELIEREWVQVSGRPAQPYPPLSRNPTSSCPSLCPFPRLPPSPDLLHSFLPPSVQ